MSLSNNLLIPDTHILGILKFEIMLDGVSLIASVLTIIARVIQGVKCAKSCYQASTELQILQASENALQRRLSLHNERLTCVPTQESVERFAILLKQIESDTEHGRSEAVLKILSSANATLERLYHLVNVKLSKNANSSSRVRKRACIRNKSKIHKFQVDVNNYRAELSALLSSGSL